MGRDKRKENKVEIPELTRQERRAWELEQGQRK